MRFAGGFFSSGDGSNRGIGGTTVGGISEKKKQILSSVTWFGFPFCVKHNEKSHEFLSILQRC